MRLIDAEKLKIDDLCDICNSADCANCFSDKAFEQWIASQPTAYDPEKVVEQLKAEYKPVVQGRRNGKTLRMGFNGGIARAIEIVKGGAV